MLLVLCPCCAPSASAWRAMLSTKPAEPIASLLIFTEASLVGRGWSDRLPVLPCTAATKWVSPRGRYSPAATLSPAGGCVSLALVPLQVVGTLSSARAICRAGSAQPFLTQTRTTSFYSAVQPDPITAAARPRRASSSAATSLPPALGRLRLDQERLASHSHDHRRTG